MIVGVALIFFLWRIDFIRSVPEEPKTTLCWEIRGVFGWGRRWDGAFFVRPSPFQIGCQAGDLTPDPGMGAFRGWDGVLYGSVPRINVCKMGDGEKLNLHRAISL